MSRNQRLPALPTTSERRRNRDKDQDTEYSDSESSDSSDTGDSSGSRESRDSQQTDSIRNSSDSSDSDETNGSQRSGRGRGGQGGSRGRGRGRSRGGGSERSKRSNGPHAPYPPRNLNRRCNLNEDDRNYLEDVEADRRQVLNQNASAPMIESIKFRPHNCRTYAKVSKQPKEAQGCGGSGDEEIGSQYSLFSQFQLYCRSNFSTAQEQLDHMQFPLLVRFFDNTSIPGYALLVEQFNTGINGKGRYDGESYWIGWTIPFWMSLPPFILSDDEKCKLTLYWIARQRRFQFLHMYRKLSMIICTYYPNQQQFLSRRNGLQAKYRKELEDYGDVRDDHTQYIEDYGRDHPPSPEEVQLLAIQPQINEQLGGGGNGGRREDNSTWDEIKSMDLPSDPFMYVINGGKGADLARNKNIGLSVILQTKTTNPYTGQSQMGISTHPWLQNEIEVNGDRFKWKDMYIAGVNDLERLDGFLNHYLPDIEIIFQRYYETMLQFFQGSPDDLTQLAFGISYNDLARQVDEPEAGNVNESDTDQKARDNERKLKKKYIDDWIELRTAIERRQRVDPRQLALDETQILINAIMQSRIKENLYRYNSNPSGINFPVRKT